MSDTINLDNVPVEEWADILKQINEDNTSPERQAVLDARDACKERNEYLFAHITEVLYEYDLMDLAKYGAPSDEYDPEAATILVRYEQSEFTSTAEELAEIIREEFVEWFGEGITATTDYIKIADEIINRGS